MSTFNYTTTNSSSVICTGYRNSSSWRSSGYTNMYAYQGYYAGSEGSIHDNRIGVIHIPDLSGLSGSKVNSITLTVTFTGSGVYSWATKNLIFRKSHVQGGINTSIPACRYAFGSDSPSSTNADTYKAKIVSPDKGKTCYDYDSDILGIVSGGFASNTHTFNLSSSSNKDFFIRLKSYIEAGNDTLVIYNADVSSIYYEKDDAGNNTDYWYSYEFLAISKLVITVNYSLPYTITLNANGGNFGTDSSGNKITSKTFTKYEDEDTTIPSSGYTPSKGYSETSFNINGKTYLSSPSKISQGAFKRQNFEFSKWNTSADGGGTSYNSGGTYSGNDDATLYAIYSSYYTYSNNKISGSTLYPWWTIAKPNDLNATYTITFDGNGGTCTITSLSADKITTWVLDGWYDGENGTGTKYNSDSTFESQIQLYANWSGTTTTGSINLPTIDTVSRKGYDFINWNTAASGTGTAYNPGASYTPTASITLYAFYEAKGLIRVYTGDVWREALVWVFDGTKWVQAIPYIFDGTEWKIGG